MRNNYPAKLSGGGGCSASGGITEKKVLRKALVGNSLAEETLAEETLAEET
jgi:hypothetical protein